MSKNKPGLSDLKRLRAIAQVAREAEQAKELARSKLATSKKTEPIGEDDLRLFARATQLVEPLKSARLRVAHPPLSSRPDIDRLTQKRARATGETIKVNTPQVSDGYTPIADTDQDITWSAQGVGPDTLRKLKRAWWPIGSQIDLHGLTRDQARQALLDFIEASRLHATRCALIIHGQGFGSQNSEGVLRSQVAQWLTQLDSIAAFATAPPTHGGRGALLVLIRLP